MRLEQSETSKPPRWLSRAVIGRGLLFAALSSAALVGIMAVIYYRDRASETEVYRVRGIHAVETASNNFRREMEVVRSDLLYLANQAQLAAYLTHGTGFEELRTEYLRFVRAKRYYQQVRILDPSGAEQLQIDFDGERIDRVTPEQPREKGDRPDFEKTWRLDAGQVFVSRFDLDTEHPPVQEPGVPVIRLATPLFDESGARRAVLVLDLLGETFLDAQGSGPSAASAISPGEQVVFVNAEGFYLQAPSPERSPTSSSGSEPTFAADHPVAWKTISSLENGQVEVEGALYAFDTLSLPGMNNPDFQLEVVYYAPPDWIHAGSLQLRESLALALAGSVAAFLGVGWLIGYLAAVRRFQEQQVVQSERRLRRLTSEFLRDAERDRRSIAQDLHDHLGSIITAVNLDLKMAASTSDPGSKDALIVRAQEGGRLVLDGIREIAFRVRPSTLDDLGFADAVRALAKRVEASSGITITTQLDRGSEEMDEGIADNLYRIVEEALSNITRHAKARKATITLSLAGGEARLEARDEGVGFDLASVRGSHLGLIGMQERAGLLGGDFQVYSSPGRGTRIVVSIPLKKGAGGNPEA